LLPAIALAGSKSMAISYSQNFTDASGIQRSLMFNGTASGTSLSGTVTVAGVSEQVSATIGTDGSLTGNVVAGNGQQIGTFAGR